MGILNEALRSEAASYDDAEWDGKLGVHDVKLFARPITPIDMTKLSRNHPNFAQSPSLEGMVDLLILKCRDAQDRNAFDKGDKPVMMRCGSTKIGEIFGALFGGQMDDYSEEDLDEDVKN